MSRQLTLRVGLSDRASFDNFLPDANAEAVSAIKDFAQEGVGLMFVNGDYGAGKTHLLYAAQRAALSSGRGAAYFSMSDPEVVGNIVSLAEFEELVCIDDLDTVAGDPRLERLLFNLVEQQKESGGALLLAAETPPVALGIGMPDLLSRLRNGASYRLRLLNDDQRREAMRLRARQRGFDLPDEVIAYVMSRFSRDTSALFGLLDRIDQASLSTKRKVTIPFVKELEVDPGD